MKDLDRTCALDVADNAAGGIVHELDANLSNSSTGSYDHFLSALCSGYPHCSFFPPLARFRHTGTTENLGNLHELDGNFRLIHDCDLPMKISICPRTLIFGRRKLAALSQI